MSADAFPAGVVELGAGRRPGCMRRHADATFLPVGFVVICVAGLEILARTLAVPEVLFPSPSRVLTALAVHAPALCYHAALTMAQVAVALFISLAIGIALATAFTLSRVINDMFAPLFVVLQIIPKIALAPLLVVWFGTVALSHLGFAVCLSFFPVFGSARSGVRVHSSRPARF